MAKTDLTITTDEIRNAAHSMRSNLDAMKDNLQIATTVVRNTSDSFVANGADAIRNKYDSLQTKYDSFYNKAESYIEFLLKTADAYDEVDQTINKNAEELSS